VANSETLEVAQHSTERRNERADAAGDEQASERVKAGLYDLDDVPNPAEAGEQHDKQGDDFDGCESAFHGVPWWLKMVMPRAS
jgi:hypothetical protein